MRVPPDQSSTLAEQAASASSGSRALSARVTLVSRVPNRNECTRLRASVTAWRKCRNSRVYWLIEPEISSSATIGGCLGLRPEIFEIDQRAARLHAGAQGAAHVDDVAAAGAARGGASSPRRATAPCRLIASLAGAISAAVICAKSFFCSTSRSDTVRRASSSTSRSSGGFLSFMPENSASCTRCAPAGGGSGAAPGACGDHHREQLVEIGALAEEDAERLVEQHRMLVPLHEHRVQRPVEILARADARRHARLPAHRAPRRARPECRPRAARARSRGCSRRGGRLMILPRLRGRPAGEAPDG